MPGGQLLPALLTPLQARVAESGQVRRVYDVAQTPLHRLLTSGILSETRQDELRERVQQIDPLVLSEHLDALRHALWCGAHLPAAGMADRPLLRFSLAVCTPGRSGAPEEEHEQTARQKASGGSNEILSWAWTTHDPFAGSWQQILALVQAHSEWNSTQIVQGIGHQVSSPSATSSLWTLMQRLGTIRSHLRASWEEPWPTELIQGGPPEPLLDRPETPAQEGPTSEQHAAVAPPGPVPASDPPSDASTLPQSGAGTLDLSGSSSGEHAGPGQPTDLSPPARLLAPPLLAQAIAAYLQEMRELGRKPQTLAWHQISLCALQQYLWDLCQLTEVRQLPQAVLQRWVTDLHTTRSALTGAARAVNTIAAYARSGRAFCNWLVRQGSVPETPFPNGAVPKAQRGLPHQVEAKVFVSLLRACQVPDDSIGQDEGMTLRNRAILWLLLDAGLAVSEVCGLRLADVDSVQGSVTVRGKGGHTRTLLLSEKGQHAVSAYLEQARLTPAWEPAEPEAQELLLLTELRQPLTKNSLTFLFIRLNQRAGFTTKPICPSMLRDTYAFRFLQAGGDLHDLQEQLGVASLAPVRCYQRFCEEQRREKRGIQACSEDAMSTWPARQGKSKRWKAPGKRRGRRRSGARKERS